LTASSPFRRDSPEELHALALRLRSRHPLLVQEVLTRVFAVSDPSEAPDPHYTDGLRAAVLAALEYGLAAMEQGEERSPPPPPELLAQARLAARNNISLDTVLRRYFAGYALLGDFLIQEAEDGDLLGGPALRRLLRAQATLFDRLIVAVTQEHTSESRNRRPDSSEQRRSERIERLLAGELLDTTTLHYDFNANHIGAIATGHEAEHAIRSLAKSLDCRLLLVRRGEGPIWAWLGSRRRGDPARVMQKASMDWPAERVLAIGEAGHGIGGWRLTHRQARAALPIALRSRKPVTRYADVVLLASIVQDDVLVASLRDLYLAPLSQQRGGGAVLQETLRAYFAAERNASSAAAALGVSRQTVNRHLSIIEKRLGRALGECAVELEIALRLEALSDPLPPTDLLGA
jgi:hypothetical protein